MSLTVGTEWVVDAGGCRADALSDRSVLESVLASVVADLALTVAGNPVWHVFPKPGGVTGMLLLTESHLVCHTYPEHGIATFNLYCCRERPEWPWRERLTETLGARDVRVTVVSRGAPVFEVASR